MRVATGVMLLLFAIGISASVSEAGRTPLQVSDSTIEYVVSNVKVLHRIRNEGDLIAVRLYLLGGSRQQTKETAGIERLLLRAAELEWSRSMAATGSHTFLEATADWTVAGFVTLPRHLDSAWTAFAKWYDRPAISPTSIARARGELLTSARRRYTQPDLRILAVTQSRAFSDHPYSVDPNGTEESLAALSEADLNSYWEQHFVTSRMLLVVVGPVSREEVESLVATTIGRMPRGEYVWTLPPPLAQLEPAWLIEHRELSTNYILGLFGGPPPTHEDYLPFRVALALLSSELMAEVRGTGSLSYAAYAPFFDQCMPVGGIYASSPTPDATIAVMRYVVTRTLHVQIPRRQWRRFLEQFTVENLLQQMTSDGQAEALARAHLYFGDVSVADQIVKRLRDVDVKSVREVVSRYMLKIQYGYLGDTLKMGESW